MADKEKIRAEVERLHHNWWWYSSTEAKYRCEAYREILDFIDSMPDKTSDDLEEAPKRLYISANIYGTYQYQVPDPDDENEIEYIKADTFIDKAATWFANRYQVNGYLDADDIEDFIKAMKGE